MNSYSKITYQMSVRKQEGAALIMSLVILVVLTLLGVTSMNTSNLQTLMTSNSQYQTVALATAEQTIREAEEIVKKIVAKTLAIPSKADGYHNIAAADPEINLTGYAWPDNETGDATLANSKYIIEYTGEKPVPLSTFKYINGSPIAGDNVYVFRITARTVASRGAVRLVQSVFVTINSPV